MAKTMLIDALHPEEVRVAVINGECLDDYDSEIIGKKQLKGNIYLAKIVRIEPALQAAFVDFGSERHGFLPFSEINPDYHKIPIEDLTDTSSNKEPKEDLEIENSDLETEVLDKDEIIESVDLTKSKKKKYRYKIQEVIKRNQIVLVQVVKEERGGKGASLTTYLGLPGRYSVLMPNAGNRSGGVSKKIADDEDRKRLRKILHDMEVPEGMSLIVRTAGHERTKLEIKKDYDYLLNLWSEIREKTLVSKAPALIYEEGNLVKKSIRDIYSRDIEKILVAGEDAYKQAKSFMKSLMPSHCKKVQLYKDEKNPLFHKYNVEDHIEKIMLPRVTLPSGGYLVINLTEALVSIDVNSGKAIKERTISNTALKTNIEAAQEVARQIRLRDLAGLIVVDFIDMDEQSHIGQVERIFKDSLKKDRAKIQVGRISQFGLMELSRQRLRPSILEIHSMVCQHCNGSGVTRSAESMSLQVLRGIEKELMKNNAKSIDVFVPAGVDLYLLNQKRLTIVDLENRFKAYIQIKNDHNLQNGDYKIDVLEKNPKKELPHPKKQKTIINKESLAEKKPQENQEEVKKNPKNSRNKKRSAKKKPSENLQTLPDDQTQKSEIENEVMIKVQSEQKENETGLEKESGEKIAKPFNKKRPRKRHRVKYSKKSDESKTDFQTTNHEVKEVGDEVKTKNTPPSSKKNAKSSEKQTNSKQIDTENVVSINKKSGIELPSTEKTSDSEKSEGKSKKRKKNWLQRLLD